MKNPAAFKIPSKAPLATVEHLQLVDPQEHTGLHAVFLRPSSPLEIKTNRILKRTVDIMLASVLIIFIFSWLFPLVALLIKCDSRGPVFFLQKRNKRHGRIFTCIKFRTMVVNEEADIIPAGKDDKRITRSGRLLRQKHLDELPQLFNVLWGDMSMIGPRPYMVSDNLKYENEIDHFSSRQLVKPGITGLAQVLGYVGCITDLDQMNERFMKDLYYITNWSPVLDGKIFIHTVLKVTGIR